MQNTITKKGLNTLKNIYYDGIFIFSVTCIYVLERIQVWKKSRKVEQQSRKKEVNKFKPVYLEATSVQMGYPVYTTDPNDGEFKPKKGIKERYSQKQ